MPTGALAHPLEPEKFRLQRVETGQFPGLGLAALHQRRADRIVFGPRLARPGLGQVAVTESSDRLPDVLGPQLGALELEWCEVCKSPRLSPPSVPAGGLRHLPQRFRAVVHEPADRPVLRPALHADQDDPTVLGLHFVDDPVDAIDTEPGPQRQVQQPLCGRHRNSVQPAGQTSDESPSGRPMSKPSRRCQSR